MAGPRFGLRGWGFLGALIALALAWLLVQRQDQPAANTAPSKSILAAVPRDAIVVATLDVAALRKTPAGAALLQKGRDAAGINQLKQLCGSDPLDTLNTLALTIPEQKDAGFGIYARGDFNQAELLKCAEQALVARGGRPLTQPRKRFTTVRDVSAKTGSAELAVSADGLLVMAEPSYVSASLGVLGNTKTSIAGHPEHLALRASVDRATLTISAILSAEQRATLLDELRAQDMAQSPFGTIIAGALGIALHSPTAQPTRADGIHIHLLLRCEDPQRCAAAARLLSQARSQEATSKRAQLLGVAHLLNALTIEQRNRDIHVRGAISNADLSALIDKLLLLSRLQNMAAPAPKQPALPAPTPAPTTRPSGAAPALRVPLQPTPAAPNPTAPAAKP